MKAKTATSAQTSLGRMTAAESMQETSPEATDGDKTKKDSENTEKKLKLKLLKLERKAKWP